MSNVFEKNINALMQRNKELAQKIVNYVPSEIPELVKENRFYNLKYKGGYLHNPLNPLGEAKEIFLNAENTPVAIHLVYGIGLGYLFQVSAANSKGTVILYEPDISILKIAFTLVDFSSDILKANVFVTSDLEMAGEYIYQKSNIKNTPLLLSTIEYRKINEKKFDEMVSELQRMVGSFGLDLRYTQETFYPVAKGIIDNIPALINEIPLDKIKDVYTGSTAVVVSAGPTLDRNIETIKKYRNNIVLIVVGTAMKALAKHNIKPDFLCMIEAFDNSAQIYGLNLEDVNFVTEPFSNPALKNFKFKNIFTHASSNMPVNSLWSEIFDFSNKDYLSKGTVSYTAINVARILGCKKIVLVGQDLAYIEGQCYSKDSAYKDLVCRYNEQIDKYEIAAPDFEAFADSLYRTDDIELKHNIANDRLKKLNASLDFVKGIKGTMVPTESVYAAFIRPLQEYTKLFPDREYINTSLEGAQIDGYTNMPLEEALKDSTCIENREFNVEFKYNVGTIKENLFKQKESLKPSLLILDELLKTGMSIKNDIKRYKNINQDILKSLKKLSTGYLVLSSEYTKKSDLFDFITTKERIDLDYEMKMTQTFTLESVSKITNSIIEFVNISKDKIREISESINKTIEVLQ